MLFRSVRDSARTERELTITPVDDLTPGDFKMTISRRNVIRAGGAAAASIGVPLKLAFAQGAEFTFKYANNQPPVHPMNVRAKEAVEAIKKETNGRMDIQIFPSNQLGSDTDTLSQLRSGGVEMFNLSGLILSTLVTPAALNGLGFAFPNYDAVWKAMDGEVGGYIRAQIAKANLIALEKIWDNGFRQITTSTKPINTADDLKGFKIRVPVSPMWTSMFKAFDSAPASINASEMYTALQTKVVDGQENRIVFIGTEIDEDDFMPEFGSEVSYQPVVAVATGLPWIDSYIGGFTPGEVIGLLEIGRAHV